MLGGYQISIFKDFFVKDGRSYSLNLIKTFSTKQQQNHKHLWEYLHQHMIVKDTYDQLLFTGTGYIEESYTHSGAFLRQVVHGKQPIVLYLDSVHKEPLYSNPMVAMMGAKLDFQKEFKHYFLMELYSLDGVAVSQEREDELNQ